MGLHRTEAQFQKDLRVGESHERTVAHFIAMNLDADVEKIGSLDDDEQKPKPMTWRRRDTTLGKLTSADLRICKRIGDQRIAVDAQVKFKSTIVDRDSIYGKQGIYFDVREHTRLSRLNQTRPCILIVVCPDLPTLCSYRLDLPRFKTPYIYIAQDDLEPDRCRLHRRDMSGKDVFVIPLRSFKPLGALFNENRHPEPANRNAPPTGKKDREANPDRRPQSV